MAGGTWTTQNKVRPGAYTNSKAGASAGTSDTTSGVVTIPLELDFGPAGVTSITASTDLSQFGYRLSDEPLKPVREALKNAREVLVFRIGGGSVATGTKEGLTATAKYPGERGNDIAVDITNHPNGTIKVDTAVEGRLIDSQIVTNGKDLLDNTVVAFEATGELTDGTIQLEGGVTTSGTGADYSDYFEALSVYDFNVMALPVEDESTKAIAVSFIKRMREGEGKKVQVVLGNNEGSDYEGVINLENGVILDSGEVLTAEQATAWFAGASAGAGVATSLTYAVYQGAVDANPRFTDAETKAHLQKGNVVFTEKRGQAVVEQDINSLVTYDSSKNKYFRKNRVLRVLDDISNNTKNTFEDHYIGKVDNEEDGRELFKANRIEYLDGLVGQNALKPFETDDIEVLPGSDIDSVVVNYAVTPIDAMEKLYSTAEVN